jgi:hypothetical protein
LGVLLLVPLTASTLAVLLAVAALPSLLLKPDPQFRAAPAGAPGEGLALARSVRGTWILNGTPLAEPGLARLLQARPPGVEVVRFQPAEGLASGEVASSLAWLRQRTPLPVVLEPSGGMR